MKKQKEYFTLTLVNSVLVGIILPLALVVKDPLYIAIFFTLAWFLYVAIQFIVTLLISSRKNLKEQLKEETINKWVYS
jgi:hypothetical protein